ncbi:conjugal transfer protein TraC [Salmonella enterica subsp. arizonae]|uniref:Conjugal transfer protein TraC n=1 Tax=Salmonella enterica subsp. arizonae TaxID=59203 RepID=A0A379XIJ6_SALER|nr:conjugal transfer protein TraC [Salmonella enterica subsp. arizonae]
MSTHENPVRQLLWCALTALRTAQEEHHIHSEARLRRYLREWLQGAAKLHQFRSIPEEIMTLKRLLDENRHVPIISTLNALFMSSVSADNCDLFRFRAALSAISRKGWRCGVCPWPEQVFSETITQACTGRESLLQLTRTEECFSSAGKMTAPVTLQLIFPLDNDNTTAEDLFLTRGFR